MLPARYNSSPFGSVGSIRFRSSAWFGHQAFSYFGLSEIADPIKNCLSPLQEGELNACFVSDVSVIEVIGLDCRFVQCECFFLICPLIPPQGSG